MLPRVVIRQVVDPVRDGLPQYKRKLQRSSARPFPSETAYSVAVGVMKQVDFRSEDRLRFPPPSLAWVLVRTDQLLFLGIDANHRQAGTYVKPPQAGQRAELRSRSGSLTSASCLRLVRSEKPASCNTRVMVFADTLIPWRRRALASFRVERCVHSKPVMGSPAVASASKLPKALKTPEWWSRSVYGQRRHGGCGREQADRGRATPQAASDGIAIQTGDTRHQGDATVAMLLCQQGDQLATTALINPSDQPVESAMLPRRFTVRMAMATCAPTAMRFLSVDLPAHWRSSPRFLARTTLRLLFYQNLPRLFLRRY